jgi:hypothetical protein
MGAQAEKDTRPGHALQPRAPRAPLVHAAVCRWGTAMDFVEVTTLNVSESGMLVRGSIIPPVGCSVEFKFLLETGFEILSGTGTVMRHGSEPNGGRTIGIAFGEVNPPERRILARVIELHSEPDDGD